MGITVLLLKTIRISITFDTMKAFIRPAAFFCLAVLICSCSGKNKDLLLSGVFETDEYDLIAPISAKLIEIKVKEGGIVKPGDTLAILDTVVVAANRRAELSSVKRAQANLDNLIAGTDREKILAAESRLKNTEATLQQAERDLKRAEKLHADNLINDRSLEESQLQVQTAKNNQQIAAEELADLKRGARTHDIIAAEAVLSQAEAGLAVAQKQFDDAFLIAPTSGKVHLLPFQIGEIVPAGRSAATIIADENLWIKIYIPEDRLDLVAVGDSLNFSVDAYLDSHFTAIVTYISSTAEFTPRNVQTKDERVNLVFAVKLEAVNGFGKVRAGMPADFHL